MSIQKLSVALTIAALSLAPMAAQAGTFVGNPSIKAGTAVGNPGEVFSSGKRTGPNGGGRTRSITPAETCWVDDNGFEHCDYYLIWCPQEGEACIEVH